VREREKKKKQKNNLIWAQIQDIRPQDIKGIRCPNFPHKIPKFNPLKAELPYSPYFPC
jgi:hypothetical protein